MIIRYLTLSSESIVERIEEGYRRGYRVEREQQEGSGHPPTDQVSLVLMIATLAISKYNNILYIIYLWMMFYNNKYIYIYVDIDWISCYLNTWTYIF